MPGLLMERVSGTTRERFIVSRLFTPSGMGDAVPTRQNLGSNVVGRHARLGPPVRGMGTLQVVEADEGPAANAAGGINASISDMAKWLQVQLSGGLLPNGKRLWSAEQAKQMRTPATITGSSAGATPDNPTSPVVQTYALGWFVQDYRGLQMVQHSGGLSGQVTYTGLLPSRGIAVSVPVELGGVGKQLQQLEEGGGRDRAGAVAPDHDVRARADDRGDLAEDGDVPFGHEQLPFELQTGVERDQDVVGHVEVPARHADIAAIQDAESEAVFHAAGYVVLGRRADQIAPLELEDATDGHFAMLVEVPLDPSAITVLRLEFGDQPRLVENELDHCFPPVGTTAASDQPAPVSPILQGWKAAGPKPTQVPGSAFGPGEATS